MNLLCGHFGSCTERCFVILSCILETSLSIIQYITSTSASNPQPLKMTVKLNQSISTTVSVKPEGFHCRTVEFG